MVLQEIKEKLGISQLELNTAEDKEGNKTEWMRHWNNDARVAINIHKELVTDLKSNPDISSLGIKTEKREGAKGEYTSHTIVKYKPAELTL